MGLVEDEALLVRCAAAARCELDARDVAALRSWNERSRRRWAPLAETLRGRNVEEWTDAVLAHRASRHPWYEELADRVSIREYATFLLENDAFPGFLPLLDRVLAAQICEEGRRAVRANIADEHVPVPHRDLMGRLIAAVKARAGEVTPAPRGRSLVDRTLIFYYGCFVDPWHLVGSLFATEVMAWYRVTHMGRGLERLGIDPADLEFIRIHSVCDDEHARDWSEGVIGPSLRLRPELGATVAEGIAGCLESSADYLDGLCARVRAERGCAA